MNIVFAQIVLSFPNIDNVGRIHLDIPKYLKYCPTLGMVVICSGHYTNLYM